MRRTYKLFTRIFVSEPIKANAIIKLNRKQSNHLIKVLRKKINDEIIIFNGVDGAWLAKIIDDNKKSASILPIEQIKKQPKDDDIWYGFAPLKTARLDYLVQKATEMGVSTIQPVITEYTQVKTIKENKIKANIIVAAQQCEILNLPKLAEQIKLSDLIKNWKKEHKGRKLIFADENMPPHSPIEKLQQLRGEKIGLIIGPEGGFSEKERKIILEQNFTIAISLGKNILRADSAAVAALALIQATIVI